MAIVIDTRIKKYIKGCLIGENEDVISIHLEDVGDTFHFDDELVVQNFLNTQAIERVGDKELRKGFFDYTDAEGEIHRYHIKNVYRGRITDYEEEIVA
ncbi:MAG: hypothetical protein J6A75_13390 [Lachnospiraceae bacterium]|nr:hypothetical protein [Lachnospiraceae bacterium]